MPSIALCVVGACLLVAGVASIHIPAGLIVAGALFLACGLFLDLDEVIGE